MLHGSSGLSGDGTAAHEVQIHAGDPIIRVSACQKHEFRVLGDSHSWRRYRSSLSSCMHAYTEVGYSVCTEHKASAASTCLLTAAGKQRPKRG